MAVVKLIFTDMKDGDVEIKVDGSEDIPSPEHRTAAQIAAVKCLDAAIKWYDGKNISDHIKGTVN